MYYLFKNDERVFTSPETARYIRMAKYDETGELGPRSDEVADKIEQAKTHPLYPILPRDFDTIRISGTNSWAVVCHDYLEVETSTRLIAGAGLSEVFQWREQEILLLELESPSRHDAPAVWKNDRDGYEAPARFTSVELKAQGFSYQSAPEFAEGTWVRYIPFTEDESLRVQAEYQRTLRRHNPFPPSARFPHKKSL